jgi:choice-of-anchor A domain-containing protein
MISMKAAVAAVLLLVGSTTAFDAHVCDIYVFRTAEQALWNCGGNTPDERFCDHSFKDKSVEPYAWKANNPNDWCDFMISSVRHQHDAEEYFPLTPEIGLPDTPGPNANLFEPILDWGCYVLNEDKTKTEHSWLVQSTDGERAQDVTKECKTKKSKQYFSKKEMNKAIYPLDWAGNVTDLDFVPHKTSWGLCHYDDAINGPNYTPELNVEYAECNNGFHCEQFFFDKAYCMPDPKADHECCISWHNKCGKKGECCAGSECTEEGYCNPELPMEYEKPPGICADKSQTKTDRKLWSRCYDFGLVDAERKQGDCAPGYNCVGHDYWADCQIDPGVKNDCCKWNWDNSNPRPGDCCVGWMSHCHAHADDGKTCISSQCIPGREMGSDWGPDGIEMSFLDTHDRLCEDPPFKASYSETLGQCTGAQCGIWGDPHIVTCDELHYDCQAVGIFTVMQNHMFNVQAHFLAIDTPWGQMSITNDLAVDWVKDEDYPTIQFSFPDFSEVDPNNQVYDPLSKIIGACPVLFYVDGDLIDISGVESNGYLYGSEGDDFYVKRGFLSHQIDVSYKIGDYYSTMAVYIDGTGPFSEWSCILTYFICLPTEEQDEFKTSSTGLLGVPDGVISNDWMAPDGQTLVIPNDNRAQASFEYCLNHWCVTEEDNILVFPPGTAFEDYSCEEDEVFVDFDVYTCENPEQIIAACEDSPQPIACQIESCIGNPQVDEQIIIVTNITELDTEEDKNLLEFPEEEDEHGDCVNLGYCLSASCGLGAWSVEYPDYNCQGDVETWSLGFDNGPSVLVGGNFNCLEGIGFEGRGVFLGDMNLEANACEYLGATKHGSLIHPFRDSICVEVGGSVDIDASFDSPKFVYYEFQNTDRACHFVYGDGCTINGEDCPTTQSELGEQYVKTNGDFKQDTFLDLQQWADEITLLKKKTDYWDTLEPNGVTKVINGVMYFEPGQDNNSVQIFEVDMIGEDISSIAFKKQMHGKTIMIKVNGDGDFNVPAFCFKEEDAVPGTAYKCGRNGFDPGLTSSIVWLFNTGNEVIMTGDYQLMGSLVIPYGSLTLKNTGQSGRLIVGGDLTFAGPVEVHNYEFDPESKPLPLPDDLDAICTVTPPVCEETYKVLTSETACPAKPEGIVKLIKSSGDVPEGEPILYDIVLDQPEDGSAHTVKFKVDNPFANFTDIFIKHVKKVGKFALDPVCDKMPFTAGCNFDAPVIEVGCHEYDGVDPFALVNIYFASDTDEFVIDAGSDDVTIDKCCKPPAEYEAGYGVIEYTFEIQCVCPPDEASQSS